MTKAVVVSETSSDKLETELNKVFRTFAENNLIDVKFSTTKNKADQVIYSALVIHK